MDYKYFYGDKNVKVDISNIVFEKLMNKDYIDIPAKDIVRSSYFGDPLFGVLKKIYIQVDNEIIEYDDQKNIKINLNTNLIEVTDEEYINKKISLIHSKINLKYGNIKDELPEQKMSVKFIQKENKVLEIGGNIGRNSLVISNLLEDDKNLVVLESDNNICNQLIENRNINNKNFHIENSALSKRKLIQKGWDTLPSDILLNGYHWVNIISYEHLMEKYKIQFDTLVLDCEGAFYYILLDMPEILNDIKLIIMENDYHNIEHYNYVNSILSNKNFKRVYVEKGGWGCCYNNFFEVWMTD